MLNYGFNPNFTSILNKPDPRMINVPAAQQFFTRINESVDLAKQNIEKAQSKQKQNADKSRRPHSFKIGDYVYLDAERLRKQSGTTKLNPLSRGPFQITKQNGENKQLIYKYENELAQLNTLAYKELILKSRVLARLNAIKLINPDRTDQSLPCKATTRISQPCKIIHVVLNTVNHI